jgi:glycogen debranching enzyme
MRERSKIRARPLPAVVALLLGGCIPAQQAFGGAAARPPHEHRPTLVVEGRPYWTAGFDAAFGVALQNLHEPNGFHRTRHARAAPAIRGVHLWDSAFLSHIWKSWDVRVAQEINGAVLDQARDGRIPHFSHRFARSRLTQPPVIAWSVWENFLWSSDTAYLAAAYPVLSAYDAWLHRNRRLPSGLFFWHAPFESGKDNSPRFDGFSPRSPGWMRSTAAVDLSSYMVLQSTALARIAGALGDSIPGARHAADAARLRALINELLWDEESGYYYDRDERSGARLTVRTAASLLPLFAGVPDRARALRLRDHIMDPRTFNSPMPLPTVPLDDPSFSRDMWRGPVWINMSYMIIRGLAAYGFHDEAAELAYATVEGVFRTHERTAGIWEFYDAERFDVSRLHRKRGDVVKRITLGNRPLADYGWSALVNTLLIEYLVGYRREGERRWITPRLPRSAHGIRLRLQLPDERTAIWLESTPDGRVLGEVTVGPERIPFALGFGESLALPPRSGVERALTAS